LKTVSKNFASKWRFELIRREYEIMQKVSHPFIVKLFGSFADQKNYNLIIEYCPGGNLFELLRKLKRLPTRMALHYFCEMLLAVQHLHSKNIIFRDIKAENILIDSNGHLKLTDFGLAKQLDSRDEAVNSFCGSPIYIAPETLRKEKYNRKVDFYALGILLYEMITGVPPFLNKDPNILKNMKLQGAVNYPNTIKPKIRALIEACLHGVASAHEEPRK
jgi:serine/threonine protein kinase